MIHLFLPALAAAPSTPGLWSLVSTSKPISMAVLALLVVASCYSWAIIFSKWNRLRRAQQENGKFLRAFRKASGFEGIAAACEQFQAAPLVTVYDYGYAEVDRQVRGRKTLTNRTAVERSLQIGAGEEIARLEKNMNWLATTAAITPFIGLFGTVWGIIDAFQALTGAGAASLRAVGPGIAEALIATAMGLFAAIPAVIAYNRFSHRLNQYEARMGRFADGFHGTLSRELELEV